MKNIFFTLILLCAILTLSAQNEYEPSKKIPFGKLNPNAPEQTGDFQQLIGLCDCKSESRNPDRTWAAPINMTWKFKYIMNGMAVQDETLKEDGRHSGSIRQYSKDSTRWYVHYYSSATIASVLSVWQGNKENNNIVLYREKKAPNGMDGFYRLTFSDINDNGFNWIGEWVDKTEKIVFPTWKISCIKRKK